MPPVTSVIVPTYDNPRYLDLVLAGLSRQTFKAFEILVADDGSGEETRDLVAREMAGSERVIKHIWHPDRGFRLAEIRNRAIAQAEGRIVILLDGDSVPHPRFVEDHVRLFRGGGFVQGHRVILGRKTSEGITREDVLEGRIFSAGWILSKVREGEISNLKNAVRLPLFSSCPFRSSSLKGIRGCNMSFKLDDLFRVNGFDEGYRGWGREDSDLALRLFNLGLCRRDAYFSATVYHLWHEENKTAFEGGNEEVFREAAASGRIRARKGLVP